MKEATLKIIQDRIDFMDTLISLGYKYAEVYNNWVKLKNIVSDECLTEGYIELLDSCFNRSILLSKQELLSIEGICISMIHGNIVDADNNLGTLSRIKKSYLKLNKDKNTVLEYLLSL